MFTPGPSPAPSDDEGSGEYSESIAVVSSNGHTADDKSVGHEDCRDVLDDNDPSESLRAMEQDLDNYLRSMRGDTSFGGSITEPDYEFDVIFIWFQTLMTFIYGFCFLCIL